MIEEALKIAARSPQRRFRTGAVIISQGGATLSWGWSHTTLCCATGRSIHAEHHALLRSHTPLHNAVCYVATLTRAGNPTNATPCIMCATLLRKAGIAKVITTQHGNKNRPVLGVLDLSLPLPPELKRYPSPKEFHLSDTSRSEPNKRPNRPLRRKLVRPVPGVL